MKSLLYYIKKFFRYISLFFFRGVLSDKDIKKLLGYHIFIYPYEESNLKASSYNLTASKVAFIKEKEGEREVQKLILDENGDIKIPPNKTAIIATRESIYVTRWITGTYHSKVKLVDKGLSHIGTTLDPCYFGISAIALTNNSNEYVTIKYGDPIVTVMFYSLKSRSSGKHDNMPSRVDEIDLNSLNEFYDYNSDSKNNKKEKITNTCIYKIIKEKGYLRTRIKRKEELVICKNKNLNENEILRRKKIIEDIKLWKKNDYIVEKQSLKRRVIEDVKSRNCEKDIFIYGGLILLISIICIWRLLYVINEEIFENLDNAFVSIIQIIIPTATLIIGMITNYKTQKKKEFDNNETISRKN